MCSISSSDTKASLHSVGAWQVVFFFLYLLVAFMPTKLVIGLFAIVLRSFFMVANVRGVRAPHCLTEPLYQCRTKYSVHVAKPTYLLDDFGIGNSGAGPNGDFNIVPQAVLEQVLAFHASR